MSWCQNESIRTLLKAGPQPVSNRFLRTADEAEAMFPLEIGQCQRSGLVCLATPVPAKELVPRYDWITYSEPEDHLGRMIESIAGLPGVSHRSIIGGISFKDDTVLERFAQRGHATWRLDIHDDLGVTEKGGGIESIQLNLNTRRVEALARKYQPADILIARHIFEHAYDLEEFSAALKQLVAPGGYLVFEIPDCTKALENCDYTMIWEEHLFYFTPATFKLILAALGFGVVRFEMYPYPFESSLVAVVQTSESAEAEIPEAVLSFELERGTRFSRRFNEFRNAYHEFLTAYRKRHGKVALLGAGHLASTFIWLFQLQKLIEVVVDDNPDKQGLYMPASRLPIVPSSALVENHISLCLLSLNPLNEERVVKKNDFFTSQGGEFLSIFPGSGRFVLERGRVCP